jgi:uncharacterized membrane protein
MSLVRTLARVLLGAFLATAGVLHLVRPDEFRAQVPAWFPLDEGFTVLASGVVEIVLGVAVLLLARHRRLVGIVVALFLVAVFPGNVAQYVEGVDAFGLDTDRARLVRLFFQPLLVLWALWACEVLPRRHPDGGADGTSAS